MLSYDIGFVYRRRTWRNFVAGVIKTRSHLIKIVTTTFIHEFHSDSETNVRLA
jgi:hypothetical protein